MSKTLEETMCEQATGIVEHAPNGGWLWDSNGQRISDTQARRRFREGKAVHAPSAGAGSYKAILKRLGFKWIKVEDWTSSAGDWVFRVWNKRLVFQSNRYPHFGFSFTLDDAAG